MIARPAQSGFSLVELSIVLVILGLLTGGILGGQALIRAAELRAVSTEYSRWRTATQTFRDKYFALPGDMAAATRFWGRMNANADCVTNSSAPTSISGVCDGNGLGTVSTVTGGTLQSSEMFQFWRHLANAGLVEGNYSGLSSSTSQYQCIIGVSCPSSKLSNAGWAAATLGVAGDANTYAMDYGNIFAFGGQQPTTYTTGQILSPEEAWNLDSKMDDSKPATGNVIAVYWNNACSTPDDGSTFTNTNFAASYRLNTSVKFCALYFRNAF
jgi:prepilin-type N-terminal cleavage/methylation domain-containing protein